MNPEARKPTHGGARPGAGRPPEDTEPLLIRPKRETARRLRATARAERKTLGQVVDKLMEEKQ